MVYDWSDGGDAEVVIEDIEHTELDMIEMYDDQQKDWRFNDEQGAAFQRNRYLHKFCSQFLQFLVKLIFLTI